MPGAPTPPDPASIPPEVRAHYNLGLESTRLTAHPLGALEFERVQSVLRRDLPPAPGRVVDIGGGAGVHALPLARRGYEVHLLDPVELHVRQARQASAAQPDHPLAAAEVGDARRLPHADASFDAALLLGPLYHLTDRADRLAALREARRVLRPGGVLFAAAVSRYASFFDGFASARVEDSTFVNIMLRDLADGQHRNPTDNPAWFTTTFFHHPDELRAEIPECGFDLRHLLGVQAAAWALPHLADLWQNPQRRRALLSLLEQLESTPAAIAASFHVLAVARTGDLARYLRRSGFSPVRAAK